MVETRIIPRYDGIIDNFNHGERTERFDPITDGVFNVYKSGKLSGRREEKLSIDDLCRPQAGNRADDLQTSVQRGAVAVVIITRVVIVVIVKNGKPVVLRIVPHRKGIAVGNQVVAFSPLPLPAWIGNAAKKLPGL